MFMYLTCDIILYLLSFQSSGFTEILGYCVQLNPYVELRTSVMGIIDAFKDIIDFICDLPIGEYCN